MENLTNNRVVHADRAGDGIVIGFEDGQSALFSADLLRSVLPRAEAIPAYVAEDSE